MNANLEAIDQEVWALQPEAFRQIRAFFAGDTSVRAAISRTPSQPRTQGVIAVIPVQGVIERRSSLLGDLFGGTSVESMRAALRDAMADPEVKGIVLEIDSPGGGVGGVFELADEIRAAREVKPIVALADTTAASAAYLIGSQASRFFATRTGQVGSVGVISVHQDVSRALEAEGITTTVTTAGENKGEFNPFSPLSDDDRARLQSRADHFYGMFVDAVAAGRGVSPDVVRDSYGKGRALLAEEALAAGMVDGIGTIDNAVREVGRVARTLQMAAETTDLSDADEPHPFRERVTQLEADTMQLVEHATKRAELRAKEGRPAFSDPILASMRSTRDALSALVDPVQAVQPPVHAAMAAPSFRSDEEWLSYLEGLHA